jgi:hypothetical protein
MSISDNVFCMRGLFRYWLPRILKSPIAYLMASIDIYRRIWAARRFYREFEAIHGPTAGRLRRYKDQSLRLLRESRD